MSNPLLSIIVPTRNRAQYAVPMIRSILAMEGDEFELVISDNSDDDCLESWVAEQPLDGRLRFERVVDPLSMTENHNRALARASGEYLCLIGDDDTVLPSALEACCWAKKNGVDAVTPDTPLRYCWPDLRSRYWGKKQAGRLFQDPWMPKVWRGNIKEEALACAARAGQGAGWLPKIYHGLVRKNCLERLKDATGAYCFGVSPDIYLALSLSFYVERQICTDLPLTIPGASGGSNSGRAALRQHKGDLRKDPHMARYASEAWPIGIPAFFSVETVWAQAALEALKRSGGEGALAGFNLPRLHALCLLGHPDYWFEVFQSYQALRQHERGDATWGRLCVQFGIELGRKTTYYARRLTRPIPQGFSRAFGPFSDIEMAKKFIMEHSAEDLRWNNRFLWTDLEVGQNVG